MPRAVVSGTILADADETVLVEGNHYFPPESVRPGYLRASRKRTLCPWKGIARYYTLQVGGITLPDAAWSYPRPSPLARRIKGYVAFWPGVSVEATGTQG